MLFQSWGVLCFEGGDVVAVGEEEGEVAVEVVEVFEDSEDVEPVGTGNS